MNRAFRLKQILSDFRIDGWARAASLVLLFMACLASPVQAVEVLGLYSYDGLVASRSNEERAEAARMGLAEVVVRVAGTRQALNDPTIQDALASAGRLLVQARYESSPYNLTDELGTEVPADRLRLGFSPEGVEDLLRRSGMPVWGSSRPAVLAWVTSVGSAEEFVSGAEDGSVGERLQVHAERRGVPLQFPMLDLTDKMALSANQVAQSQAASVRAASTRYNVEHALAGSVRGADANWSGNWVGIIRGESFKFQTTGNNLDELTASALDQYADRMAMRYAVHGAETGRDMLELSVDGVSDIASYARVTRLLRRLTSVQSASLGAVYGSTAVYRLEVEGTPDQIVDQLSMSRHFGPVSSSQSGHELAWRMHYRYIP